MTEQQSKSDDEPLTLGQLVGSVAASMFGVQSNERRERDFRRGKFHQFLIVGIIFTGLFIAGVWGLVQLAFKLAGV